MAYKPPTITETDARRYFDSLVTLGALGRENAIHVMPAGTPNGRNRHKLHLQSKCLEIGLPIVAEPGHGTYIAVTEQEVAEYVRRRRILAENHHRQLAFAQRLRPWVPQPVDGSSHS